MAIGTANGLRVDSSIAIARAKLPDDLDLVEFTEIVSALNAVFAHSVRVRERNKQYVDSPVILRAQYGSDFVVYVSIAAILVPSVLAAGRTLKTIVEVRKSWWDGSLAREEALAAKEKRLEKRHDRSLAKQRLDKVKEARGSAPDASSLAKKAEEIARARGAVMKRDVVSAAKENGIPVQAGVDSDDLLVSIDLLADYAVDLVVERSGEV